MKKITALLMCSVMLCAAQPEAYMADDTALTERRSANMEIFFDAFPVITQDMAADGKITRAEFAGVIRNILDRTGEYVYAPVTFSDVTAQTAYAEDICIAAGMGFMAESPAGGRFRPDDVITDTEAAAGMVHLLGCDYLVGLEKSYTAGVWKAMESAEADIERFSGSENAQWIKKLVFKSLKAHPGIVEEIKEKSVFMGIDRDSTYMSKYWEVEEAEGILSKSPMLDIYGKAPAADNCITIGESSYTSYLLYENTAYLGSYVNAYVSSGGDDEGSVLCMYPDEKYKPAVIIDGHDINDISNLSSISAQDENGRTKRYSVSELAGVFCNFEYAGPVRAVDYDNPVLENALSAAADGGSCQVILAENTNDGKYDFVWIRVFENYTVRSFSYENYTIDDKYGESLDMSDAFEENRVVLFDSDDRLADATDIESSNIVSLFTETGANGIERAVGYLSKTAVSGTVDFVEGNKYYINGGEYYAARRYLELAAENNKNTLELKPGLTTTFYINRFSEIAAVSLTDYYRDGVSYAFVISVYFDEAELTTAARLLNEDGEILTAQFADKVTVNGVGCKDRNIITELGAVSGEAVTANTVSGTVLSRICNVYRPARITVHNSRINNIELGYKTERTAADLLDRMYPDIIIYSEGTNTDGSEVKLADGVYKSGTFGKRVGITTSTVMFDVPIKARGEAPVSDYGAYMTTSVSNMQDDCMLGLGGVKKVGAASGAYMEFFDTDSTLFASAAVRYYAYNETTGGIVIAPEMQSDCIIVSDVVNYAINEDNEQVKIIKGYRAGSKIELQTEPIKNESDPWIQFTTLTDSVNGARLEKADGTVITPEQVRATGVLPGDVIQVTTNSKNEISNILINVRAGDGANDAWLMENGNGTTTSILSAGAGHGNEYLGVNYGTIEEMQNGKVVLSELDGRKRVYSVGSPTVTVYERKSKSVRKGTSSDIKVGREMYIRQYYSQIKEIVVFVEEE